MLKGYESASDEQLERCWCATREAHTETYHEEIVRECEALIERMKSDPSSVKRGFMILPLFEAIMFIDLFLGSLTKPWKVEDLVR